MSITIIFLILIAFLIAKSHKKQSIITSSGSEKEKKGSKKITSKPVPQPPKPALPIPLSNSSYHWEPVDDWFQIVGESHYQSALAKLAGKPEKFEKIKKYAAIIPDDKNPHDNKAVRIEIDDQTVGYLSKGEARSFRRRLGSKNLTGKTTSCDCLIRGGGKYSFSVVLNIKNFY